MNTRAGQYSTDASIRVPRRSAAVEHIEAVEQTAGAPSGMRSGEHASSGRTYPTALAPRAAAGFMLLMAAIGSTAGLAWRLHSDLSLLTESEHRDRDELEASVQRLEVVGQQAAQRLDALQQAQTKQELQLTEIRRLSEHVSSLQGNWRGLPRRARSKNLRNDIRKPTPSQSLKHSGTLLCQSLPRSTKKPETGTCNPTLSRQSGYLFQG